MSQSFDEPQGVPAEPNAAYHEVLPSDKLPDFTDDRPNDEEIIQLPTQLPQYGWRAPLARGLRRLGIILEPGKREQEAINLAATIRRSLIDDIGAPRVKQMVATFVSQNGGVGKTAITAYVSAITAAYRPLAHVVAVDGNRDRGILLPRLGGSEDDGSSLREFHTLTQANRIQSYSDLVEVVANPCPHDLSGRPQNVAVIRSDPAHRRLDRFGRTEYVQSLQWLSRLANVVTNDCGTDIFDPLTEGALRCTNQLVYITDPTGTGLKLAIDALSAYASNPYIAPEYCEHFRRLVSHAIIVVNKYRDDDPQHRHWLAQTEQLFPERVYRVPYDPGLDDRRAVNFTQLHSHTVDHLLRLTAGIFAGAAVFTNPPKRQRHLSAGVPSAEAMPIQPVDTAETATEQADLPAPPEFDESTAQEEPPFPPTEPPLSPPVPPAEETTPAPFETPRQRPGEDFSFAPDGPPLR